MKNEHDYNTTCNTLNTTVVLYQDTTLTACLYPYSRIIHSDVNPLYLPHRRTLLPIYLVVRLANPPFSINLNFYLFHLIFYYHHLPKKNTFFQILNRVYTVSLILSLQVTSVYSLFFG